VRGATNPFGIGFGARLGFLVSHVYFGGSVTSYLGGTDVDTSESAQLFGGELGYDFGIPVGRGFISLRPQVGLGIVRISRTDPSLLATSSGTAALTAPDVITQATRTAGSSGSSGSTTSSSSSLRSSSSPSDTITVSNVYLQPGVTALYSIDIVYLGANANILIVPGLTYAGDSTTWLSFGFEGQAGLRW